MRVGIAALAAAACLCLGACQDPGSVGASTSEGTGALAREQPGLHNVLSVGSGVISGSQPHGEEGFDSLGRMGVRTIISVDGTLPELGPAEARGMRYIHIPIRYSGITDDERLALARAIREADGPIYFHCHHGKHRGPAATAYALVSCGRMTPEAGLAFLEQAGTSHAYPGLFDAVANATPVSEAEIGAAVREGRAALPAQATTSDLVSGMVAIDAAWDHMKAIRDAGWRAPEDHPDLAPAAEAGMLADLFRHLQEGEGFAEEPADFRGWMADAQRAAQDLEDAIVADDTTRADEAMGRLGTACDTCHAAYRNE